MQKEYKKTGKKTQTFYECGINRAEPNEIYIFNINPLLI